MNVMSKTFDDEPDLSSLPMIRIDQISLIDTTILGQANADASQLLHDILIDYEEQRRNATFEVKRPTLASYLEKQISSVNEELARRSAANRINDMLRSVYEQSFSTGSVEHKPLQHQTTKDIMNTSRSNAHLATAAINIQQIPSSGMNSTRRLTDSMMSRTPPGISSTMPSRMLTKSSKSSSSIRVIESSDDTYVTSATPTSRITRPKRVRDVKQDHQVIVDRLSEKAVPEFIVSATEKKLRFYPKKASTESIGEMKAKDRAERRKQAMKRLIERREKRQQQIEKQQLEKRLARLNHKADSARLIPVDDNDSKIDDDDSASDSVSGGDDDISIDVDPLAVKLMAQVIEDNMCIDELDDNTDHRSDLCPGINDDCEVEVIGTISPLNPTIIEAPLKNVDNDDADHKINDDDNLNQSIETIVESTTNLSIIDDELGSGHRHILCDNHEELINASDAADSSKLAAVPMDVGIIASESMSVSQQESVADATCTHEVEQQFDDNHDIPVVMIFSGPTSIPNEDESMRDRTAYNEHDLVDTHDRNIHIHDQSDQIHVPVVIPPTTDPPLAKSTKQQRLLRTQPQPLRIQLPNSILTSNEQKVLSSIYPHIGMIFAASAGIGSVNLSATSHNNTIINNPLTARTLIESMHLQCKLYEEWIEVMRDYATVFSEERDINATSSNDTSSSHVYNGNTRALHYRVKSSRPEVGNIIKDVLSKTNIWHELPGGLGLGVSWNLLWTWSRPRVNASHLLIWQRVNHFEENKHLTQKDLLRKSLQRYTDHKSKTAESFEIMPQTYVLPHEYTHFVTAYTNIASSTISNPSVLNYWIMKPVGLSRGRGISLIKDVNDVVYCQSSVIQRYLDQPLLLNGFKFDLRIYVLVTSFQPLEAFIYKDGFARLSTEKYSISADDIDNKFIHLTNSSIQKYNTDAIQGDVSNPLQDRDGVGDVGGSKICLQGQHGLWRRLQSSMNIDSDVLWQKICEVVLKSLVVVDDKVHHQPCSFEVFGFDVIFDQSLRAWLLEVNASPSLARENNIDHRVKDAMIQDTINLLDIASYDRAAVASILKRRLRDMSKNKIMSGKNDAMLEADLKAILGDHIPRRYGEMPAQIGNFERLCPHTKLFDQVVKLKSKLIKPVI